MKLPFMLRAACGLILIALVLRSPVNAQLPVSRLGAVYPAGLKQGGTVEVEVIGNDLDEPARLYFTHPGLRSELIPPEEGKAPRFKVMAAADVPVGWYDVRFVGKNGISNPRTFVVSDVEELEEKEPNDTREGAMRVEIGRIVNGQINIAEDADWFVVSAKAGQRLLVECLAWRIDSKLDGYLTLYDATGRELAASQDEAIRSEKYDPLIDFDVPADGDYYLKLVDFTYSGGGKEYAYRLQIGTQPLIDFVLPTGGKRGETSTFTLFGRNLPGGERTDVMIKGRPLDKLVMPMVVPSDFQSVSQVGEVTRPPMSRLLGSEVRIRQPGNTSNGRFIAWSDLPEGLEQEPNNTREQAQRLTLPCAISGQFNPTNDRDLFVFTAKKGEKYTIEVMGQRVRSPVDADVEILNAKGDVVTSAQDDGEGVGQIRFNMSSRDVRSEWTAPEDGDYTISCEHLFGGRQGGPQYVYRLQVTPRTEEYHLLCVPTDERRKDSHLVEQGGRLRLDVLVWRLGGHNSPITVNARNLPPGVSCEPIVIGQGIKWGTLVLTAAKDAAVTEAEIEIAGTSQCNGQLMEKLARGGVIMIDTVNTPGISRTTRSIVLAVRRETPYVLTAVANQLAFKQGEPLTVNVQVERKGSFANEVKLIGAGYQLPPGMQIPLTSVPSGQGQGSVVIKTDGMPPGTYSFVISGEAQVPYERKPGEKQDVRCVYPSNPITITVNPKQ